MLSELKKKQVKKKVAKSKSGRKIKDFSNDPFFVKKAEESQAFLEKHGFPKDLLTKK
jgi:hypothetical protein